MPSTPQYTAIHHEIDARSSADGHSASLLEAVGWCAFTLADEAAPSNEDRAALQDVFENGLAADIWLPQGHTYRQRAYQCYDVDWDTMDASLIADPPTYRQTADINPLAGGIRRRFRGLPGTHPATAVVRRLAANILPLTPKSHVDSARDHPHVLDAHFIRIAAPGKPCPEGIHRDGLVVGSIHLVGLRNVEGGATHFWSNGGDPAGSLALTGFLDSVMFDDEKVFHYTDDITPEEPTSVGYRDVVLLGLRAAREDDEQPA
jgi:hypothetical protein